MIFKLFSRHGRIVAIVVPCDLSPRQLSSLTRITGDNLRANDTLRARWNVANVICDADWAKEQLERVPCTVPKDGMTLAFV